MSKWLTSVEYRAKYEMSRSTLWIKANKYKNVQTKTENGVKYYLDTDEKSYEDDEQKDEDRINVIYARVFSSEDKEDLDRQLECLRKKVKEDGENVGRELIDCKPLGYGKIRKGLRELCLLVSQNKVKKIYISSKDRLSIENYSEIEYIFQTHGTNIVVLGKSDENFSKRFMDEYNILLKMFKNFLDK